MTEPSKQIPGWTGPWSGKIEPQTYPECDDADLPWIVRDAVGREVVFVPERYDRDDYEAIGRLIAAAPDLYEALASALDAMEPSGACNGNGVVYRNGLAALAKALGQ